MLVLNSTENKMADRQALIDFFNYVDSDGSGFITVAEIHAACDMDIDGNGTISADEQQIGSGPWLAVMSTIDLNVDQQISLAELLAFNGL